MSCLFVNKIKKIKKYKDICKIKSNISKRISLISHTKYLLYKMNDKGPRKK